MFPQDSVGKHLGRYEVLRKLATGGMAEIYLGRISGAAGFEKLCVLKRIPPSAAADQRLVTMFLDEARLSATLRHPNIADVFDLGTDRGSYFFAMEFIHGQDARMIRLQAFNASRPIPLEIALATIHGVTSALAYAHDKVGPDGPLELVHRDISPGNILISYDGAVKLVDFGIARATSRSTVTKSGTLKGKIPYMSPEQCQGQPLDRRSDLFSLGIVLYELTVGCRPYRGNSEFAIMERIVNRAPYAPTSLIEGYPPDLESILMKLLSRDRAQRYQNAHNLLTDLETFTAKHRIAVTQHVLAKYMRTSFPGEIAAWEYASQHGTTLAQHLADTAAMPAVRPPLDSPAFGSVVVRAGTEPERMRAETDSHFLELDDDDIVSGTHTSEVQSGEVDTSETEEPPTLDERGMFARSEIRAVERKLGITDDLLSYPRVARVPSKDFSMDDPTHQAKHSDMVLAIAMAASDRTAADVVRLFDPIDIYRAEVMDELDAVAVPGETGPARVARRFEAALDRAVISHTEGEHDKAVVAVELALSSDPDEEVDHAVIDRHASTISRIFEAFLGDLTRQPALARQLEDLACLPIGPEAAFLLSRIDGMLSFEDLLDISGMPRHEACRHLCQLFLLGILQ